MKVDLKRKNIKKILMREKKLQKGKIIRLKNLYIFQRKILTRENKSQNWFARKLGISSGYMSQIMTRSRNPSPKLRERIMKILPGYKWDELFKIKE